MTDRERLDAIADLLEKLEYEKSNRMLSEDRREEIIDRIFEIVHEEDE